MKHNHIISGLLLTALSMTIGFSLQSCKKDQPNEFELTGGTPTVYYIRPASIGASDSRRPTSVWSVAT